MVSSTWLLFTTLIAYAQTTQELFRLAEPGVIRLEIRNDQGKVFAYGSGFLVSADGKFITNLHVVQNARSVTVRLANDDAYDTVDVIDVDRRKDIALLRVKAIDLPFLKLGKSADVKVGDPIYAIGTPLGLFKNTLSDGIVSGIRAVDGYRLFQVTAPVSHGSSGGPVLNPKGEVIGIVASLVPEGENLNFVIPIDYARGMLLTTTTQPLSSIYEAPPPEERAPAPVASPEVAKSTDVTTGTKPEEIRRQGLIPFLASKLFRWTEEDAKINLGEPLTHRFAYDSNKTVDGDIYSYGDPTKTARFLELAFDVKTKKLRWASILTAPGGTQDQAKKTFGDRFQTKKNPDGTMLYLYQDKRLNLGFDKKGGLTMIQLY